MNESPGPRRPSSLKVKLLVELEEEDTENLQWNEDSMRPHSEDSWKEQFLRLVREAPSPVPVLCSEPRKFPHLGKRLSDSSWTSGTTRFTGVTLSSISSFDISEDEGVFQERGANNNSENVQNSSKSSQRVSNDKSRDPSVENEKREIFEFKNDQANKEERLEGKGESLSLSSSSDVEAPVVEVEVEEVEASLPLGNSDASRNVQVNEESHQVQGGVRTARNKCSLGIYEDPEYWEKFRYSKDYQSSLMIETICNEVFNLMPSSRYRNLMKLSQKKNARKIERGNKKKKRESHTHITSEGNQSVPTNNDDKGTSQSNVERVEQVGGKTKKEILECSTLETPNELDADGDVDIYVNQNGHVTVQGDAITLKDEEILLEGEEVKAPLEEEDETRKKSFASTISSAYTTSTMEEDAEDGRNILEDKMRVERMVMLEGFGQAFHGYLTKQETENLLKNNGQYLIRQIWKEKGFILSFRFDEEIRNYRIICSDATTTTSSSSSKRISFPPSDPPGNNGLYTYSLEDASKCYNTLDELVREGLLTLHLDENAGSYIDLLVELAQHQRNDNFLQTPPSVTPGSRKCSRSTSVHRMMRLNSSSSNGPCGAGGGGDAALSDGKCSSPSIQSTSGSMRRDSVYIALLIHYFEEEIFDGLARCQVCSHALWGCTNKGLKCRDCSFPAHESCIDNVRSECKPNLASISPFSMDLTTLVKGSLSTTEGSSSPVYLYGPPYILERCVNEVEARGGLTTEGIYRISGSVEEIERLKNLFEKERINTNLSECPDIHSITGLIKFFLRQLPDSLITQEVFQEFIREGTGEITSEIVQMLVSCLPPANRITLKYLLDHLKRIAENRLENKMNAFNLSSVLMPSVMRPANMFDDFESSTKLLHFLILYVDDIQF